MPLPAIGAAVRVTVVTGGLAAAAGAGRTARWPMMVRNVLCIDRAPALLVHSDHCYCVTNACYSDH